MTTATLEHDSALMRLSEIAEQLSMSKSSVRPLIERGQLPLKLVQIGRSVRVSRASFEAYLKGLGA